MGFMFLMFLTGLEINFNIGNKKELLFPFFSVVALLVSSFFILYILGGEYRNNLFYFTLISSTSAGIIFITLKLKNIEKTGYGKKLIWLASIGEMVTIFFIIMFDVLHKNNGKINLKFFFDISGFFVILFIAYLIIEFVLFLLWKFPKWVDKLALKDDTAQINMRMIFFIMLLMISMSIFFDLEAILGAFLGGLMVSFVFREKEFLEKKIGAIAYGFFIPFFFIKIGWDIDLKNENLLSILSAGLLLYLIILSSRLIGSFILSLSVISSNTINWKSTFRDTISISFLWSAPISIVIALAQIGLQLEAIDSHAYSIILLSAVIGGVLGSIGFNIFYPKKLYTKYKIK